MILLVLSGAGCLRFGYDEALELRDGKRDAGGARDAGPAPSATSGGRGGIGGSGGMSGAAGTAGSNSGGGLEQAGAGGAATVYAHCPERPGMLFCDGFEDPTFDRWEYTVSHNATLELSTAQVRKGKTSLLARTGPPATGTEARWATEDLAHLKSGHAWMRSYNFVPASVVVTKHFSIGVMSESAQPWDGFELRILPSLVDINSTPGVYTGTLDFPRGKWVCVELHVFIDANAGYYEAWFDGALAVRSQTANTLPADGFTAAEVGIHYADPKQDSVEVYVDDVVVGTSRIPCD